MCGIAGRAWLRCPGDPRVLETMSTSMRHRGPDDRGTVMCRAGDMTIGLASTRLSILDLTPAGHMPMANRDKSIWLVYNGEIYNHAELRRELGDNANVAYRSRTDTETLLYTYEDSGLECFPRLNGMFACAFADLRRNQLVLARDRMGIKPLYYHWDGHSFTFASELKMLLQLGDICATFSSEALELYLALGYVPSPYTLFNQIKKLDAGHYLVLDREGVRLKSFWKPDSLFMPCSPVDEERLPEVTRKTLDGAVRRQLMGDVPVGVFLSGGLDSTIITAAATAAQEQPLHTFTIGFRTTHSNLQAFYNWDRHFARQVAAELGTVHHEVLLDDSDDLAPMLESAIGALDEPLWEPSFLSISLMAKLARKVGVTVLLAGDGSDELFAGYPWYLGARRQEAYDRIPCLGKVARVLQAVYPCKGFRAKLRDLSTSHRSKAHEKYLYNQRHVPRTTRKAILGLRADERSDVASDYLHAVFRLAAGKSLAEQYAFADQMLWVREHFNLRIDRMTMLASVEARVPFQDNEVVDLAASIPFGQKVRNGEGKFLLKEAYRGSIPATVLGRSKRPFAAPGEAWLSGRLRNYAFEQLSRRSVRQIGVLDAKAVEDYAHGLLANGFSSRSDSTNYVPLLNLLSLVIWLKQWRVQTQQA